MPPGAIKTEKNNGYIFYELFIILNWKNNGVFPTFDFVQIEAALVISGLFL